MGKKSKNPDRIRNNIASKISRNKRHDRELENIVLRDECYTKIIEIQKLANNIKENIDTVDFSMAIDMIISLTDFSEIEQIVQVKVSQIKIAEKTIAELKNAKKICKKLGFPYPGKR